MDTSQAIEQLRAGHSEKVAWPSDADTLAFAESLDADSSLPSFRQEFLIPTKTQLKRTSLLDAGENSINGHDSSLASSTSDQSIYFCGNSLGLQPKAISEYLQAYLKTWGSIGVAGHFTQLEDSPLAPYQDMAADCSKKSAEIFGASPEEIVVMNTLTVNLHLMIQAFYKPTQKRNKIMIEWRPFPSDYYAVESQIEGHGFKPQDSMLLVQPDEGSYIMSTDHILSLIEKHADELALILLPGIQYYSGQLLDIPTITKHAHSHGITIGWDLAHAAGNVELRLHDWEVDFACWCTYKYMNAGAGAIAGAFIHLKHGDNVKGKTALKGWYGGDKSVRFLMDNNFVPTPGAQGYQLGNPSAVDLSCLSATLSVFNKTSMTALRSKSLLLTGYADLLLNKISRDYVAASSGKEASSPYEIITPLDPRQRGAQLSVLLREELMEQVSKALEAAGVICDKRKPGCIRVAPAPLYNTFAEVWRFMQVFAEAVGSAGGKA